MPLSQNRWRVISPSEFPWEREALDYVKDKLPDRDPYLAWSNFEFIGDDGSINEVDLLLLTPRGLFLIEIKSGPGVLEGDAGTWTWTRDGRRSSQDNPLILANRKAKKLASLLRRQKAFKQLQMPYIEARVFLSAPDLKVKLETRARNGVHVRDESAQASELGGITEGLSATESGRSVDRAISRAVSQSVEQAGIRPHQASRQVGDFQLDQLLSEGPGYQDWQASHISLKKVRRRIRLYPLARASTKAQREILQRAAQREFQILEGIQHSGILRAMAYHEHERGPALVFEHDPDAVRLDHFLRDNGQRLALDSRLDMLRQIAEALQYAHERKLYHRALAPQSLLVRDPGSAFPRLQLFNWQTARRDMTTAGRTGTATEHMEELIDDASRVYLAPESLTDPDPSPEALDVFSVGTLAYHLFTGSAPASTVLELGEKLRAGGGLRPSTVADGVAESVDYLVFTATCPLVANRLESISDAVKAIDEIEEQLTRPDSKEEADPAEARKGDSIQEFEVLHRLGKGSTSVAFLARNSSGDECVLKVALDSGQNDRLKTEAEVLQKLRHQHICGFREIREVAGRSMLILDRAGERTLAQRLHQDGPLGVELLQRFGEDLLLAVDWLEQQGVPHRDIKPTNIGIAKIGRTNKLHLVLFDFSLSRAPAESIRAGTVPYLDPFLALRKPPRWDLHAERFAAAMTLHEMATGVLPKWADGLSDPAVIEDEVTLDEGRFDPDLRPGLVAFFRKALARDWNQRFGNCEAMRTAWTKVFEAVERPTEPSAPGEEPAAESWMAHVREAVVSSTLETPLPLLGLATRALNALDRLRVARVADLLRLPLNAISHMPGVGSKTRREIVGVIDLLATRFPDFQRTPVAVLPTRAATTQAAPSPRAEDTSLQVLANSLVPAPRGKVTTEAEALSLLVGLNEANPRFSGWSSQTEVASHLDITRARVGQIVGKARKRWSQSPALAILREEVATVVGGQGGVVTARELAAALRTLKGETASAKNLDIASNAVARALVEAEHLEATPRYNVHRAGEAVVIAETPEHADYAERLGRAADQLANTDPIPSPARAIEDLQAVRVPQRVKPLATARLLSLAVATSQFAALSSRLEVYPRSLSGEKALLLAQQALLGARELTTDELRQRVLGRYPESLPLPERPALDGLLAEIGFTWSKDAQHGRGAYVSTDRTFLTISRTSTSLPRYATALHPSRAEAPEIGEARQFQSRQDYLYRVGGFIALTVAPRYLRRAEQQLMKQFDLERLSLERALVSEMHTVASREGAEWKTVCAADAAGPDGSDWGRLKTLVARAVEPLERQILAKERPLLLVHPGLLARYDQVGVLDRLRDAAGRPGKVPAIWALIAADGQQARPLLDGKAVPVLTANQWARVPDSWLENLHRAGTLVNS